MVRGNWQKRVESAQARREEQRARKARKGDREAYRVMASGLMSYLSDNASGQPDSASTLHVWVDSPPLSAKKSLSGLGSSSTGRGSGPSGADDGFASDEDDNRRNSNKKQQIRKKQQGSARKAHPRQGLKHSHAVQDEATIAKDELHLCSHHFFYNKCAGAGGGGGRGKNRGNKAAAACKLHHSSDPTLAFALKEVSNADGHIASSAEAAELSEDGAMNMLWYLSAAEEKDETNDSKAMNEVLQGRLSRNKIGAASIMYVVWGNNLIYDRNRGGLQEETGAGYNIDGTGLPCRKEGELVSKQRRRNGRSRGESQGHGDYDANGENNIPLYFPGSVLETILIYLPDTYTASLPLACRSWHAEIGQSSPNLWRQLLLRRKLPLPRNTDLTKEGTESMSDQECPRDVWRDAFISHYEAIRDVRAISELVARTYSGQTQLESSAPNDACMMKYFSNPGAPDESSGSATSVKVWGDGKVLVSYKDDCTLRLFEAVSSGGSLGCRQTVSVIASPEPKSKRGRWFLTGMNLDEQYVCCFCLPDMSPLDDGTVRSPFMLILNREDILCASGGESRNRSNELEEESILCVNLREELVNYLMKEGWVDLVDTAGDREDDFIDYVENEDHSYLKLMSGTCLSSDIVACGRGRFLFSVTFALWDEDGSSDEVLAYRLFLYSVNDRKVIWSTNISQFQGDPNAVPGPRIFGAATSCTRQSSSVLVPFRAILTFPDSPRTALVEILKDGRVNYRGAYDLDSHHMVLEEEVRGWGDFSEGDQQDGRNYESSAPYRAAVITSSTTVVAHNVRITLGGTIRRRAVLTFSSNKEDDGTAVDLAATASALTLPVTGECEVACIQTIRSNHIILLCRTHATRSQPRGDINHDEANNDDNGDDEAQIGGEWFGITDNENGDDDASTSGDEAQCIFLIHALSQTVIGQYRLPAYEEYAPEHPCLYLCSLRNTIALEIEEEGLIIGGRGVRNVLYNDISASKPDEESSTKAKKKKRLASQAKGRNKDGFARGMSVRG
mmetsp:Transcript_522/g.760  ORF Transcript_522/g.760 Transcript_522/m.760 type:complete len:1014 (+) Transcript_522:78-3119(+)